MGHARFLCAAETSSLLAILSVCGIDAEAASSLLTYLTQEPPTGGMSRLELYRSVVRIGQLFGGGQEFGYAAADLDPRVHPIFEPLDPIFESLEVRVALFAIVALDLSLNEAASIVEVDPVLLAFRLEAALDDLDAQLAAEHPDDD